MSDEEQRSEASGQGKVDLVSILYVLGGVPAIVAFLVILFVLVRLFPSIPA